jgi:hypothetical protein
MHRGQKIQRHQRLGAAAEARLCSRPPGYAAKLSPHIRLGITAMKDESELSALRVSDLCGDQVPDEIRTKIGELVNRWAYVEYQLKVIIRVSLGLTRATQNLLLHNRDLRSLCELVKQVAEADDLWVPDAPLRDELKKLSDAIAKGSAVRNAYAHGVFAVPRKGDHAGKFSRLLYQELEHKINPDWQPTKVNDFVPIVKKAERLGVRAQNATVLLKRLKR